MVLSQQIIYQVHCGRAANASVNDHPQQVFRKMADWPWNLVVPNLFEWVYLLGIFDYRGPILVNEEQGQNLESKLNRTPSLFAITNHQNTLPALGDVADFKQLLAQIHEAKGKVMVDYVANHTGTTHPWVKSHPEFYKREEKEFKREFSGDALSLNFEDHNLVAAQIEILKTIAAWGVDGVRCDMAHLVPNSFWAEAITTIKQLKPDFKFLAEAYSDDIFNWTPLEQILTAGFDSVYDEFLYRNLKLNSTQDTLNHLNYIIKNRNTQKLAHYLANHDDPILPNILPHHEAWLVLLMTLPGPLLLYNGQLNGLDHRLSHHTIELLPQKDWELTKVPDWFTQAKKALSLGLTLTQVSESPSGVIEGQLSSSMGKGLILINLTSEPIRLPLEMKSLTRFIHPTQSQLSPGQAEIAS